MRSSILTAFIIATALFMENMDGTVLATSLPAIASDLHQDPIALKLALTSYMLTLAVFIPASGWVADKLGARTVFCSAIAVFTIGSILCGASNSLPTLIGARVFQGLGGAMMVPVGRLVLLRTTPKSEMVDALAYLTVPALIGPVVGPPLGGFITTYFHWRWIFWINVPIGLLGIALSLRFIENVREQVVARFDFKGFFLSGLGLLSLVFGLTIIGRDLAPVWAIADAGRRRRRPARALLPRMRAARSDPIIDLDPAEAANFLCGRGRRLPVPARHRRDSIPAAADAADRLRAKPVPIGLADFRGRGRRDGDEILRLDADPSTRLPTHPRLQRADLRGLPRLLRACDGVYAALAAARRPAGRRLFPFARSSPRSMR